MWILKKLRLEKLPCQPGCRVVCLKIIIEIGEFLKQQTQKAAESRLKALAQCSCEKVNDGICR